jgi:hypothetical protein
MNKHRPTSCKEKKGKNHLPPPVTQLLTIGRGNCRRQHRQGHSRKPPYEESGKQKQTPIPVTRTGERRTEEPRIHLVIEDVGANILTISAGLLVAYLPGHIDQSRWPSNLSSANDGEQNLGLERNLSTLCAAEWWLISSPPTPVPETAVGEEESQWNHRQNLESPHGRPFHPNFTVARG